MDYVGCVVTCGMIFSYANAAIKAEASNMWHTGMNCLRLCRHAWNLVVFSFALWNVIVTQGLLKRK